MIDNENMETVATADIEHVDTDTTPVTVNSNGDILATNQTVGSITYKGKDILELYAEERSDPAEHKKEFYNASGCADPTAYQAIQAEDREYRRFQNLLHTLWSVCRVAGFSMEGRVTLVDKRTGRVWR